ncbi:MAG: hypothetical protein H6500_07195 [Candidatus Woesearchaeota archaeon]|nr:hypothetical protein [Nanoarchaeota archaeon]USN44145.1 MAG: hypothetical protein H6500_07195 [Candidatus Woesearchaeota archaeon]
MKLRDKTIRVVLSREAEKVCRSLKGLERKIQGRNGMVILTSFERKIAIIKQSPGYEHSISKDRIPRRYKGVGIKNLYRIELPEYWRSLYTLQQGNSGVEVIAFVLTICTHAEYDVLFSYHKK